MTIDTTDADTIVIVPAITVPNDFPARVAMVTAHLAEIAERLEAVAEAAFQLDVIRCDAIPDLADRDADDFFDRFDAITGYAELAKHRARIADLVAAAGGEHPNWSGVSWYDEHVIKKLERTLQTSDLTAGQRAHLEHVLAQERERAQ